ncbi:MAG TPA: serine/threonine-protein kinase [Longimicrobiales bacterium]
MTTASSGTGANHPPTRWTRLQEIFHAAVALPEAARPAFLDGACRGEPALRADVEKMLRADALADAALDGVRVGIAELAAEALDEADGSGADDSWEGRTLGPYRVLRKVGQGGMGAVYEAEREDVHKRVALKVVRGALGAPDLVRRFLVERRVLARLAHPAIAGLLDAGMLDDDTPWLAMELVEGAPITRYCEQHEVDVATRLRLFLQVCEAVDYAHAHLIVHRDIKPSNVLVDEGGRVRLLDFGIAKLLGQDDDAAGEATRTGLRVLSPEYAAPEQFTGAPITTATDVHALGVLLFELLTGERPYAAAGGSAMAAAQAVVETEPPRPSSVAGRSAGREKRADRRLAGDLDAICLKALAKDPARRYRSARQLGDDIVRHLEGVPVEARLPTLGYSVGRFVRRNAALVGAAALVTLALATGLGAALWQSAQAQAAQAESEEVTAFVVGLFEASDPEATLGQEVPVRTLLEQGSGRVEELAAEPRIQARMLSVMARAYRGLGDPHRARELAERAIALRSSLVGREDAEVAASVATLAQTLDDLGDEDGAIEKHREALEILRGQLGPAHERTTYTALRLSRLLALEGQWEEAQKLAAEALRLRRAARPPDPEAEAEALRTLATVRWWGPQDLDGAEALYREALTIQERLFGPDDPRVESGLVPLGGLLAQQRKFEEAESVARRALELRTRIYGPDHPSVAYQLSNVAYVLSNAGRHEEAATLYREVVERYRAVFPGDHPRLATALTGIAITFGRRGMVDSTLTYMEPAAAMIARLNGPDHPETALAHHNLGMSYLRLGRHEPAARELELAYETRSRLHGASSPGALRSGAAYASALAELGRYADAERLVTTILAHQREQHPEGHPDVAVSLQHLGEILERQGRVEEATPLLEEALAWWRSAANPDTLRRRSVADLLVRVHEAAGRPERARRIRQDERAARTAGVQR